MEDKSESKVTRFEGSAFSIISKIEDGDLLVYRLSPESKADVVEVSTKLKDFIERMLGKTVAIAVLAPGDTLEREEVTADAI